MIPPELRATSTPSQPGVPSSTRNRWLRLFKILAPLLLVALAVVFIDFRQVGGLLLSADRRIFALLLLAATLDRVLMALRWFLLLRAAEIRVPFRTVLSYYYQGSVVSFIPPSALGGDLFRAWLVTSRHDQKTSSVLATIAMEKVLATLSASFLGIAGLGVLLGSLDSGLSTYVSGVVVAGTLLIFAAFAASLYRPFYRRAYRLVRGAVPPRLRTSLERFHAAYILINRKRWLLVLNFATTIAEHLLQFLIMYFAGRALGVDLPGLIFMAAIALILFARRASIYLDAWGVSEAVSILLFRTVAIHQDMALSISLLVHVVHMAATVPAGLILLLRSGEGVGRQRCAEIAVKLGAGDRTRDRAVDDG